MRRYRNNFLATCPACCAVIWGRRIAIATTPSASSSALLSRLSLLLGAMAMLLAVVVGVCAGTIAALRKDSLLDRAVMALAMTGISIPVFVIAPVLVLFSGGSSAVAAGGLERHCGRRAIGSPGHFAGSATDRLYCPPDARQHDRCIEQRLCSHGARARSRHQRHRALARIEALDAAGALLHGTGYRRNSYRLRGRRRNIRHPGLGQHFVRGALNRDYTLVLGIVIFYAVLVVLLNLIVDLLYGVIDPRIRRR